jgi:hypothetical protein
VVNEDYQVVGVVDEYLQHLRLGRDAAESTTKADAESHEGTPPHPCPYSAAASSGGAGTSSPQRPSWTP